VDKRRIDRARKFVHVHFNVRLMRKVRAVDYNSVNFAWEVEEVQVESEVT